MTKRKRLSPEEQTHQTLMVLRDWLNARAKGRTTPLMVGFGGPGGSGKSKLVTWLLEHMRGVSVLHLDDFRLPRETRKVHGKYGSHPQGNDLSRLRDVLEALQRGEAVNQPVFCRDAGEATAERRVEPERIVIVDGEIAAHKGIRDEFDHLVLVDAHWRTQLNARLSRDIEKRGCDLEKAIHLFLESNLRDYPTFSEGADEEADVIVYRTAGHGYRIHKHPA